jgi:hypothetical protein
LRLFSGPVTLCTDIYLSFIPMCQSFSAMSVCKSVAFVDLHFNFHLGNHFTIFLCVVGGCAQAQELIPKPVNSILSMLCLSCSRWKCKTQNLQSYKNLSDRLLEWGGILVKHLHGNVCTCFWDGICSLKICVCCPHWMVFPEFLKEKKMWCKPDHNIVLVIYKPLYVRERKNSTERSTKLVCPVV